MLVCELARVRQQFMTLTVNMPCSLGDHWQQEPSLALKHSLVPWKCRIMQDGEQGIAIRNRPNKARNNFMSRYFIGVWRSISPVQYSRPTVLYSTTQYCKVLYCTVLYSAVLLKRKTLSSRVLWALTINVAVWGGEPENNRRRKPTQTVHLSRGQHASE